MNKYLKKSLSMILALVMVLSAVPVFAASGSYNEENHGVVSEIPAAAPAPAANPEKVMSVINAFAGALKGFTDDTSKMQDVTKFLTRFGGLTSTVSGVIGILQMTGVIKDPVFVKLDQVLDDIHNVQSQLGQMENKIDTIRQDLARVAVRQEEIARANKASEFLRIWREFNRDYCEPLDNYMEEYENMVNEGIKKWWGQNSHEGIWVLYTANENKDGTTDYLVTYSSEAYSEGIQETADNGETVYKEMSFGFPAEYMPNTKNVRFNIDTYRDSFIKLASKKFIEAADGHKLDGPFDYTEWDQLSRTDKEEEAGIYAARILDTLVYHIACDTMTENNQWVVKVRNAYTNYCENVLAANSGINAFINAMFKTHGFEGEIKDDINSFCDAMVIEAGFYSTFALSCVSQDKMQSLSKNQDVQKLFMQTIESLSKKKSEAITGYDNFCYITGTKLEYTTFEVQSNAELTIRGQYAFYPDEPSTIEPWKANLPNIVDGVYSQMLFNQYERLPQGKSSFITYLRDYGVIPDGQIKESIVTRYGGPIDFNLDDGLRMERHQSIGNYFRNLDDKYTNVNKGNSSKIENKYFLVHDKVICDTFNLNNGTLHTDDMVGARAIYGEHHSYWIYDELCFFFTDNMRTKYYNNGKKIKYPYYFTCAAISSELIHNLNGEYDEDDANPFYAFDRAVFPPGVSDIIVPDTDETKNILTDVRLNKNVTYTGKELKPAVTVKAGKKTVPSSGYDVSFTDNLEIGSAMVKVEGKGEYAGTVIGIFKIVPKGTAFKKISRTKKNVKLSWKKQSAEQSGDRIAGYQIRWSTKSSMKNANKKSFKGYKKTSGKISGLKNNKKYYIQIRTYYKTKRGNIYSKWSGKKTVKTGK